MADEVASLLVRVTADGSQAIGVLNGVATTVGTLADKNATLLNKVSSVGTLAGTVGKTITKTFGVATVAGLTASAKAAGQLNKELANIGTLSVPTERLTEFKGQIQDIAIATGKNTSDISEGTYQVISAFGDAADTMEKVEINAKAAKAGLATTADSIALTSAVTKAYGDTSASAVQHVADLAFKTVELGQTTFPELAQNMQQVTSLSKQLGVSQEELFASYATLTGVTGNAAEVQTQLKAVYNALLKPSENMEKAIRGLGYESGYTMINTLGLAGTLDSLVKATNGSDEALLSLFNNQRALPAILALTGAQADVFTEKLGKMKEASGAATKAFEVQTEGVAKTGFTLEQAKVKMQVAAQKFGESAAPLIGDAADIIDRASSALANLSDEQRKSIINTGVNITKTGLALAVGGKAVTVGTQLVGTAKAIGGAIAAIPLPVTLAVAGITALGVAGKVTYDKLYEAEYKWADGMQESAEAISKNAAEVTKLTDLQKEVSDLKLVINSPDSSTEQVETAQQRIKEIAELLSEEYNLKINADTADVESALNLLEMEKRRDFMDSGSDYLETMRANRDSYIEAPEKISGFDNDLNTLEQQKRAYEDIASSLGNLKRGYDAGTISQKEYLDGFVDLLNKAEKTDGFDGWELAQGAVGNEDPATGLQNALTFAINLEKMIEKLGGEYDSTNEKYKALTETQRIFEESAKFAAQGYSQVLASDILNGNWGDVAQVTQAFQTLGKEMKAAGANTDDVAKEFATAKQGFTDFQKAIDAGAGDAMANDFIAYKKSIGDTAEEAVRGAALIKSGFSDVSQVTAETLPTVLNNMRELGNAQGLDMTAEKLTQMAQSMKLIPENKHVEISAQGDISIVNDIADKINLLDGRECTVTFNADGSPATATIEGVEYAVSNYDGKTHTATLTADDGASYTINFVTGEISTIPQEHDTNITATDNTGPGVQSAKDNLDSVKDKTVTLTVQTVTVGGVGSDSPAAKFANTGGWKNNAKGTQNFSGGLAMVNDQTGIADNRELIIDRGRAFIPQGRNVILPLSKGAKVYTAAQTKAIMSGLGIPHYAEGKNNSDAFTAAKDDYSHFTKTHAVTTAEQLQKWLEFQEQYKENEKDIWDIEEQIFSLQQKLYSERISESEKWLAHEEKYNGMSVDDYLAGIDRMKAYTEEYYAQGIISHKEYTDAMLDLDEKYIDKRKEQLEELYDLSKAYISEHTYFNDWAENGDDPLAAYNRVMDRHREALANGDLTQEEFNDYAKEIGSDMYSERKEQSLNWLEEQRKYFGMSDEEYVRGLERIKEYTQQYYNEGLISRQEYNEAMTELNHSAWDEAESAYEDMLSKQQEYISDLREQFSKQEQALRDSWDVEDRAVDMADVQNQLDIYKGAVTDRGQQKYKELQEQMKQLQRDEELYQLQVANNATIESLEAEYKQMEDSKANILEGLRTANVNISAYVDSISDSLSQTGGRVESLLGQLLTAFNGFQINAPSTTYADNRTVNVSGLSLSEFAGRYMGGLKI